MKALLFLFIIISFSAWGKCSLYSLSGLVTVEKDHLHLLVARKTASEKKLPIAVLAQDKFSPYVNHFIAGKFILNGSSLISGMKILEARDLEDKVFDPLNQNQNNSWKKLKDIPCPEE